MKLIEAIKKNCSEKGVWEYQYKIDYLSKNGVSLNEISDNQQNAHAVACFEIDAALQKLCGGVMSKQFREFATQMNIDKKLAFPKK